MDSVYVLTQNPPETLSEKEMLLSKPTFLEEVKACSRRKGFSATLGPNYLRAVAEEIGRRYDKHFNAYRNVVPQDFMGRVAETDEQIAEVVHEMFQARYPVIYQRYYESVLRSRPFTTRVIYFTGSQDDAVVFQRLGINEIDAGQVSDHLGIQKPLGKDAPKQTHAAPKAQEVQEILLKKEEETPEAPESSKELELLASLADAELSESLEETAPAVAKPAIVEEKKTEQVRLQKQNPKPNRPKEQLKTVQPAETLKS